MVWYSEGWEVVVRYSEEVVVVWDSEEVVWYNGSILFL